MNRSKSFHWSRFKIRTKTFELNWFRKLLNYRSEELSYLDFFTSENKIYSAQNAEKTDIYLKLQKRSMHLGPSEQPVIKLDAWNEEKREEKKRRTDSYLWHDLMSIKILEIVYYRHFNLEYSESKTKSRKNKKRSSMTCVKQELRQKKRRVKKID